ncbi:MAG TPA: alpha/beta hydrolase [Povalibacter sp.]
MNYTIRRIPQLEVIRVRELDFQLYRWPGTDPDPVVLLHGWGDSAATWQFVADEMPQRHTLVAFDARGFGRTRWPDDGYWFPDYLADLEALLDVFAPQSPVDLVGHSMGANVASLYAGIRPQRVRRLVSLEGFGLERTEPQQAVGRYRAWLDELKQGSRFSTYDSFSQFAQVLARRNPRTPPDRLEFIAQSWGQQRADGRIELRADPRHKRVNPVLYQRDQAEHCWQEVLAPVLFVTGAESESARRMSGEMAVERLRTLFRNLTFSTIPGAGHMVHHEQPAGAAELIDEFCR